MKAANHIHHTGLGTIVCIFVSISSNKILKKYYLVFALSVLGGDNDVLNVERGRLNKRV